jgi:hypothetical protein
VAATDSVLAVASLGHQDPHRAEFRLAPQARTPIPGRGRRFALRPTRREEGVRRFRTVTPAFEGGVANECIMRWEAMPDGRTCKASGRTDGDGS